jgi:hypothetical protein
MALCEMPCLCQRGITVVSRAFKCFLLHFWLLEDDCCCAGRVKHREFDKRLLQLLFWIGESMYSLLCKSAVHGTNFFPSSRKLDL